MSPMLERDGITWDWFSENWAFGNGVTVHKTTASPDYKTVVHGTSLNLDEFLAQHGTTELADLKLERLHIRHEGWEQYEARWLPGTTLIPPPNSSELSCNTTPTLPKR